MNRKVITTEELKALMYAHFIRIAHKKSHYTGSQMLYFDNSGLTVKKLYMLFRVFYRQKKDEAYLMTLKHYYKLFQAMKFAIRQPKTDICDVCEMYKIQLIRRNPTDNRVRIAKQLHKRKVQRYKVMTRELLRRILTDTLVV